MSITQTIQIDIIRAEINDECRVDVTSARKTVDLSADEAIRFGNELIALGTTANREATRTLDDLDERLVQDAIDNEVRRRYGLGTNERGQN